MEFTASEARSNSPWITTIGGNCNLPHNFSSISSITSCISISVFTNTFQWYISGSLIRSEEAVGLRVTLLQLKANRPARFGMILSAKSDSAETTLLFSGFLREGLPTIKPLGLRSFLSFARAILISAPDPWPKQKQGSLGWISSVLLMKFPQSFRISFWSSRYPRSPCDLPWPRWSNPTAMKPSLARRSARWAVTPVCMPIEWKMKTIPLASGVLLISLKVANLMAFLSWLPQSSTKFSSEYFSRMKLQGLASP